MPLSLPPVASVRDFYAFEQHVKTCRAQRGLGMVPQWYDVPVFYFSNPDGVIFDISKNGWQGTDGYKK